MDKIKFDPQQFANAYLSSQNFDLKEYENEKEMIEEAFAIYLMAFERAREFVEKTQKND
ncbi:hypothetical protein [Mammaliicoccus sciuri]|uniref:hypothetical protein n=1 Tax=Mammaliicoccus sciuri TaxID=1296 RepID=UPI0021D3BC07|nr:hypothetical protein [Mammaliicoccus sciuri]UXV33109.1 hypothetical protein MUA60_04835 [Mammaliicoccus sciuri]